MVRFVAFSAAIVMAWNCLGWADLGVRSLHVVQTNEYVQVNATLPVDDEFIADLKDALNSGVTLKVSQTLTLQKAGWRKKKIAKNSHVRYIAYDALRDQYQTGADPEQLTDVLDFGVLQQALFKLQNQQIILPESLERGEDYRLLLTIELSDPRPGDWLDLLSFAFVWETKEIAVEIPYVAR